MTKGYYRDALKALRERTGGASDELKQYHKENTKLIGDVRKALQSGLQTVPDLSNETGYDTKRVFFAINVLRRYEKLLILSKREDYPQYGFEVQ